MKTRFLASLFLMAAVCALIALRPQKITAAPAQGAGSQLQIIGKDGKLGGFVPLRHTQIKTEISGFVARILVTQEYENVLPDAIEAIYVFPLPHDSAVDGMTMKVGDREIQAVIKERAEAKKIYDAARNSGHTAALLDQERPNIFTQSVANIPPGSKVEVTLSVLEMLKYEAGTYEFAFPLVVGPRYIPGSPTGAVTPPDSATPALQDVALKSGEQEQRGTMKDTDKVPDASKISPPVAGFHTSDEHAGHDVSFDVSLAAGVPIAEIESTSHKILADRTGADSFHVQLADETALPNKDFILKYKVAGPGISDAVLSHADQSGGYFSLILQPPERVPDSSVVPREIIFVLDTSGSMWGFPLEMAKKTIARALDNLRSGETFNLITFSGDTRILFPGPVEATQANILAAKKVLAGAYGSGGTEMMKAIRVALGDDATGGKLSPDHLRVVCFMTDGYVGDDAQIVAAVQKHPESRVFAFGIGTAVNRFLLAKMAEEGHGEVEFVTSANEAQEAADRFYERVHSPVLTNIALEWRGLQVDEVYPQVVPDLFSVKPIIVTGRYTGPARGTLVIHGRRAGGEFTREIAVEFPANNQNNAALEKIWARRKVDDLMSRDWEGIQNGQSKHKAEIIEVGLKHSLATQYTSFVAVEEKTVVQDGKPVRIEVPVELPEGVSPLAVPGQPLIDARQQVVVNTFSGTTLNTFAGVQENQGVDRLALFAPGAVNTNGASMTVEVTAAAPTIETTQSQVTHTFDGDLLNPSAHVGASGGPRPKAARVRKPITKAALDKLSAELKKMYECATAPATTDKPDKCALPASNTVEVKVELTTAGEEVEKKLTAAGLTITAGSGTMTVTGNLAITSLKALAEIAEVKSISQHEIAQFIDRPLDRPTFTV